MQTTHETKLGQARHLASGVVAALAIFGLIAVPAVVIGAYAHFVLAQDASAVITGFCVLGQWLILGLDVFLTAAYLMNRLSRG